MQFTVNLSGVHPAVAQRVIKSLHHADAAQHTLGLVEQMKLKKLHDAMALPGVLNTNIGRQTMTVSRSQWQAFMKVYGQKCWSDPDFEPWVLKQPEHADLRVKDVGMKIQSGYTGKGFTAKGNSRHG